MELSGNGSKEKEELKWNLGGEKSLPFFQPRVVLFDCKNMIRLRRMEKANIVL